MYFQESCDFLGFMFDVDGTSGNEVLRFPHDFVLRMQASMNIL